MKFNSLILCEACLIDSRSNSLSFINIIEEMNFHSLPAMITKAAIIAQIEKESLDEDVTSTVNLDIYLNNVNILKQPLKVDFKGKTKTRVILEFQGLPIQEPGLLKIMLTDGIKQFEYSVDIKTPKLQAQQV